MVPCSTAPLTILVGIPLDVDEAKELLTWAINILSNPRDTIVALHVLGKEPKKLIPISRDYNRFRRAKTFVLSTMGEFAEDSQCRQVNLEARVRYGASIGSGLIDEAKRTSATFLVLRGSSTKPNGKTGEITRYCMKRVPKGCSIISMGQLTSEEVCDSSAKGTTEKRSPRTVLSGVDRDDDNSSFDDSSSNSESSAPTTTTTTTIIKSKESPLRRVASFFLRNSPSGRRKISESTRHEGDKHEQPVLKCFSFDEISLATNDFHPDKMIGQGGYSEVYRGDLSDGNSIAVKRLTKDNSNPNKEKEFLVELGISSQVSHPNTATLIGYCIENGLYLIFPLSPNGNLFNALHGNANKPLEWEMRYKIALGVARGLDYLHKSCKHRIIHRDIKASNVLLGPNYEPQITDFGLAKWLPASKSNQHAVLPIEGTFGYLAPEYFMHGIVDEKTDVFAFGILLLEIVTGQRPINSSKESLLLWAMPMMESGKTLELVDPRLEGTYDVEELHKIVVTASCCIRHSAAWRPTMTEVLELLTHGQDPEHARRWSMLKSSSGDEMDDYSMVFGYSLPVDIDLQRAVAELEYTLDESTL
ncbi:putative receptor-like serine/threonine-protein kinase At5g57670 isoform X2 [Silene latifolia]|uniref:putative receptor-like serine/threonine-protein kinase At5g57670 isoform X2 n=1 Tax=Silene latifolia TaxID=37657 RepID=UPI003D787A19